jgi:hypothetical protein
LFAGNDEIEKKSKNHSTQMAASFQYYKYKMSFQHYRHKTISATQRRNHSITGSVQMLQTEKEAKGSG